jgi:chromosome segregation ATPase
MAASLQVEIQGADVNEADLRRHLDEAHRQLLDRDNAFRFHEDEVRARDVQIEQLREELDTIRAWARDLEDGVRRLEATVQEMEATLAWRLTMRLRSLREAPRRLLGRKPGS